MTTVNYLDRFLEPITQAFTPELAQKLVAIRSEDDPELHAHIEELRQKASDGQLTSEEDAEYKEFVEAVDVISILQSKARRFLSQQIA